MLSWILKRFAMKKSDLELYTPERWYINIYKTNGTLILSHGFTSKSCAESFLNGVLDSINSSIKGGAKVDQNVNLPIIEEAIGWKVGDETFSDYHEALWCSWNNNYQKIEGIFKKD